MCIILIVPYFFIFCLKDLSFIIKMARIGAIAVTCYGLFILYIFIDNLATGTA